MSFRRSFTTAAAACGLLFASAAVAAPATDVRAAAPAGESRIGADIAGTTFINIAILAAISIALVLIVEDGDGGNDSPNSP